MDQASNDTFTHVMLPSEQRRVLRLGLAGNYGISSADAEYAAERGVNYWLWSPRFPKITPVLKKALARDRDAHVVSVLGNAVFAGGPRKDVEKALRVLGVGRIDCYKLGWVGRASRFSDGIQDTLAKLKDEGKVGVVGCSIHDRKRAGELARDSILDTFMLRYNAKHPGAEQDVFPHLSARNPTVIAYTATSWRQLLKPVRGLERPPLTAGICYRFCLTSPHVHVCLTGPASRQQLEENLDALDAGPLSAEEEADVRAYGLAVREKTPFTSMPLESRTF